MKKNILREKSIFSPTLIWTFLILVLIGFVIYYAVSQSRKTAFDDPLSVVAGSIISSNPAQIDVEINEGETSESFIAIKNEGSDSIYLNFYKSNNPSANTEFSDIFENDLTLSTLLKYKNNVASDLGNDKMTIMKNSIIATGVSWFVPLPIYKKIESKETVTAKLILDATKLEPGNYNTFLLMVGNRWEETLTVSVNLIVKGASRISVSGIEIIDETNNETVGNSNEIVENGERVQLNITLTNSGKMDSNKLSFVLNTESPTVQFLGSKTISDKTIPSNESIVLSYSLQIVSDLANGIPPTMELTIQDGDKARVESFYLGEEDKIEYPSGLKLEE